MNDLLQRIDAVAERLERLGHVSLAAVLDNVSEQLVQRNEEEYGCAYGTCADGSCADAAGMCRDGSAAVASAPNRTVVAATTDRATTILTAVAPELYESVERFGASAYAVDRDGVEIALNRNGVETTAAFAFCRRENEREERLRVTFEHEGDRMVRWARVGADGAEIVRATAHIFSTGKDFEPNPYRAGGGAG